jgi:hypothetical protein
MHLLRPGALKEAAKPRIFAEKIANLPNGLDWYQIGVGDA